MSYTGFAAGTYFSAVLGASGITDYPVSIQAWIKGTGTDWDIASGDRLVELSDNTTENNSSLIVQKNADSLYGIVWDTSLPSSLADTKFYTTVTDEFDDLWVPCWVVWTNSTTRNIYIWDSNTSGAGGGPPPRPINTLDTISLGSHVGGGFYLANCYLAEVAIWDIALSTGEMDSLGGGEPASTVQTPNLIAYWTLLDASTGLTNLGTAGSGADLTENGTLTVSVDHPIITSQNLTIEIPTGPVR